MPPDVLLNEIVSAQAMPGFMDPRGYGVHLPVPRLSLSGNITGQSLGVDRGELPW